ncbi:MAG: hypothetical protein J5515_08905 [Lachnospiraceae bacterium]|nr:hypothetical protein [Lachnospiraceae bacterium]
MKLPILLICSLFISFFLAFVACFFIAKITSAPAKLKTEEGEFEVAGIKYDCKAKNIKVVSTGAAAFEKPSVTEKRLMQEEKKK